MTTRVRLLAILVAVSGVGLSVAVAAGGTSKDTWKGAWKFEIPPPRDQPWLSYYDSRGKTVFRFGCGTHYEMDAVYPGSPPKQDHTEASITIANVKTQMDFAGFTYLLDGPGAESWPPNTTMFNQADLGHPELDEDKWGALEDRFLDLLDSGRPLTISAEGCRRSTCRAGGRASRNTADAAAIRCAWSWRGWSRAPACCGTLLGALTQVR
jgi:hypothetical protein